MGENGGKLKMVENGYSWQREGNGNGKSWKLWETESRGKSWKWKIVGDGCSWRIV